MTMLRVKLNCTLKRQDGTLITEGAVFNGLLGDLPEEIRLAVAAKKRYVEVEEIPEVAELQDELEEDLDEADAGISADDDLDETDVSVSAVPDEEIPDVIPEVVEGTEKKTLRSRKKAK